MTKKVFLPKWVGWFTTIIIAPLWFWISYDYFFNVSTAQQELGLVGYLIISFVLIISVIVTWLMALGKLPAYIIKEEDEREEKNWEKIKLMKKKTILIIILIVIITGSGIFYYFYTQSSRFKQIQLCLDYEQMPLPVTGLPEEIENNEEFLPFIVNDCGYIMPAYIDRNLLPFEISSKRVLDLSDSKRVDIGKDRHFYWDSSENPKFFISKEPAGTEDPKYLAEWLSDFLKQISSPDGRYVVEVVSEEPNTLVYLWDLKEKKVWQINACGTPCRFYGSGGDGVAWLDNKRFIIWGEEANPQENYDWSKGISKFVIVYNLNDLSMTQCSSKTVSIDKIGEIGISDEAYIEIAKETNEAQGFLEKYPRAKIIVERSGALAVDFRVDISNKNYLRLRIFMHPRDIRPLGKFIDCSGSIIEKNLLEYLQTEKCLKSRK